MFGVALLTMCSVLLSLNRSAFAQEATMSPAAPDLPGVTDVLVDDEHCRGAHVSTRPHNRKVVYHAPSATWFVFYGTGHWMATLGDAGADREMMAWRSSEDGRTFTAHAPQIVALDEGRVACVLFAQHEKRTGVHLYDPDLRNWSQPQVVGQGYKSKRACAVFDPGSRRLHIVYTDAGGDARHRALAAPYAAENWSPPLAQPGTRVAEQAGTNQGDDDLSLSADLSRDPAPLALVHRGPDLRLHLRYYDGTNWSARDVNIGLQDPAWTCDEASAIADFSHGLGFLYWCQRRDKKLRNAHNNIGQLRFCLVRDAARLFASE